MDVHKIVYRAALDVVLHSIHHVARAHIEDLYVGQVAGSVQARARKVQELKVERLIPRKTPNTYPTSSLPHNPALTYLSSNKMPYVVFFWVPVLETWFLTTFRSLLPATISLCLLFSVSTWARLSFHLHWSHSRHLGFPFLWFTFLQFSERRGNPLCSWIPPTSHWQLQICLLPCSFKSWAKLCLSVLWTSAMIYCTWHYVCSYQIMSLCACVSVYVSFLTQKGE